MFHICYSWNFKSTTDFTPSFNEYFCYFASSRWFNSCSAFMCSAFKMFSKRLNFVILTVIFLLLQGAACFFVKHVQTGMCISVTSVLQTDASWGKLFYVELSNNCLNPAAQCRFLDNSAMFNLQRKSCFEGTARDGTGYNLPMLYFLQATVPSANCRDQDHAITQTSWGGLSVYYLPDKRTRCAVPGYNARLATNQGIDPYIALTNCNDAEDKRFNFGSVTCHGNMTKNVNCPKDQYMVVKNASYHGLSANKTCGLSDDYSCQVDVTCLVKKQCDGQHECNITVNETLFSGDPCPGLTMYLYFEYQCINTATSFNGPCAPNGPPLNIKTSSRSTSSLSFTWDPPEKNKQNGVINHYTACVSHSENGPCFQTFTTSERKWLVGNLNASAKYYVHVLASNKGGSGVYSGSKGFFTNGKAAKKASEVTSSTLTFSLQIPSKTFLYFYVVALKLKDDKEPTSSDSYENSELVTYAESRNSTNPKPYIAAVVASSGVDENMFILGDGRNTSNPTSRRRRSTSSDYYNGPLEPGTSYSIFQRIVLNEKSEYYSTDWSPASKTNYYTGKDENDDGSEKYLAGIIVLAVLLVISFVITAYFIYQNRRLKSSKANLENKSEDRNNSKDICENPDKVDDHVNYEDVENEQSTYTALKRTGNDENDDHLYSHLNEVNDDNVIQKETGI